jgi:hypothetical protein
LFILSSIEPSTDSARPVSFLIAVSNEVSAETRTLSSPEILVSKEPDLTSSEEILAAKEVSADVLLISDAVRDAGG